MSRYGIYDQLSRRLPGIRQNIRQDTEHASKVNRLLGPRTLSLSLSYQFDTGQLVPVLKLSDGTGGGVESGDDLAPRPEIVNDTSLL